MRGVRCGCPASGFLFTMAFVPVYRWLRSAALPPELHRPWFVQRCACAYADDVALAPIRPLCVSPSRQWQMLSRLFILSQVWPSNTKKCHWTQYRNLSIPQLSEWVGTHGMQINDHAKYLGIEIGPSAANHRWTKARNKFVGVCARVRTSSQGLVQRLVSFKIFALSVLSNIGLAAEPDAASVAAETLALQRLSAGSFHSLPSALLRRGSVCGLLLTSKAARFRVCQFVHWHGTHPCCKRPRWQNPRVSVG